MIGPGTGLAPFRGFLQERAHRKAQGAKLGPAMLFFGCRHPEQDFLYADELKAFAADGITELHTAFSRADGQKTYVQHLVAAQKDRVWNLIEQGAIVYVCGDGGKMEPDVKAALVAIYRERSASTPKPGSAGSTISERRTATCSTSGRAGRSVVPANAGTQSHNRLLRHWAVAQPSPIELRWLWVPARASLGRDDDHW